MISVEQARELILNNGKKLKPVLQKLSLAAGSVLAAPVKAVIHLPSFDQSAMDGYAFRWDDLVPDRKLNVIGIIPAGKVFKKKLKKGEAVRIFTGAPIPPGADTVVMQENVRVDNGWIFVDADGLAMGDNIRKTGSQIRKGDIALAKGTILNPASMGLLASLGIREVPVHKMPEITILVNGDELKTNSRKLAKGKIHESNSVMLKAALAEAGISSVRTLFAADDPKVLLKKVKTSLKNSDFLILCGGISVGEFDYTHGVLASSGVKQIFYKVRQKPGKPLFFGVCGKTLVFGLPGNPAAALTCFYEYILPGLRFARGLTHSQISRIRLPLRGTYSKKKGLTHFLKGVYSADGVHLTEGQESYILKSYAEANCLVSIPEETEFIPEGTELEVHPIG